MRRSAFAFLLSALLSDRGSGLYDPVHKLQSARLYGSIDGYAYYFVDLIVGTPPQRVSVILDSGSGLAAFPCAGCPHCGTHIDPLFDISKSSSAQWMPCGGGCSGSCKKGHCSYSQSYLEGSGISGYWFQDWVRLGDAIQRNPPVWARMGCHQNENNLFYTQKANGIFGIEGGMSLLMTLFKDSQHVNSKVFAICLAEEGGRFTVGGPNTSNHHGAVQYVRQESGKYLITLNQMKVGGKLVSSLTPRIHGNALVDSGTTYTYFGSKHYNEVHAAVDAHCRQQGCVSAGRDCWKVERGDFSKFPIIDMVFGSSVVQWKPNEYMSRRAGSSKWCYAFRNDGPKSMQTLGASFMLYKEVIFDLDQKRIGFVPASCPSYKDRPKHFNDEKSLTVPTAPPPGASPPPIAPPAPRVEEAAAPAAPKAAEAAAAPASSSPSPPPVDAVARNEASQVSAAAVSAESSKVGGAANSAPRSAKDKDDDEVDDIALAKLTKSFFFMAGGIAAICCGFVGGVCCMYGCTSSRKRLQSNETEMSGKRIGKSNHVWRDFGDEDEEDETKAKGDQVFQGLE
eukprot:TRINITY_DN49241_c0_g1_i1.p1 TRINITY_DN49241_c0_g1~~TRINITY_DN49241_c0_g1_i1.p1  ORF type:complete len:566 (+),score=132.83 TRINITY_DN49241_c0_g1_i1:76-1773(+)